MTEITVTTVTLTEILVTFLGRVDSYLMDVCSVCALPFLMDAFFAVCALPFLVGGFFTGTSFPYTPSALATNMYCNEFLNSIR